MPRTRRPTSKAGRNEQRKLLATLLNNLGVAAILGGFLQPTLAFLRQGQAFGRADFAAALVLGMIGAMLHSVSRLIVSRLED